MISVVTGRGAHSRTPLPAGLRIEHSLVDLPPLYPDEAAIEVSDQSQYSVWLQLARVPNHNAEILTPAISDAARRFETYGSKINASYCEEAFDVSVIVLQAL